ncbi:MAG: SGNH/GDSL hydrolase family protein [Candidatus Omnitrophota bacterium]
MRKKGLSVKKKLKWYSFRWQIGVVLFTLFILCWHCLVGRFYLPAGTGPAGPSINIVPFKHIWSADKIILLGLGDSITKGFGSSEKHSYFELLTENDDSQYPDMKGRDLKHVFPNLKFSNYSENYTVSEEHLRNQIPQIEVFPASVKGIVVITTGGNDLIHDYGKSPPRDGAMYGCTYQEALKWENSFRNRLKGVIEGVIGKFPGGCEIFVANVYDPTDGIGLGNIKNAGFQLTPWPDGLKVLALFNGIISEVCSSYENVHLVDIYSSFLGHGIHCRDKHNRYYRKEDPHYWYFCNFEDPNDRGYDAIRRLFLFEIIKVFCKNAA